MTTENKLWGRRAHTMAELFELFDRSSTEACKAHISELQVRPNDVFISTYAKSGTTWMQQIVHGLRTRGSMDFKEISEVIPFIEVAWDCGIDLNAEQVAKPRAFKAHMSADQVPAGGRYVIVVRDPKDAAVSFYNFMVGWYIEPGTVQLDEFIEAMMFDPDDGEGYWNHLTSWWPRRHDDDVILFSFEDMKLDPLPAIRQVSAFIGVELDDELMDIVTRQSSIEFMKAHEGQFDDNILREARDGPTGLPPGSESSKVKTGKVGGHKQVMSDVTTRRFDELWAEIVTPVTGAASYDELRKLLT